jgi:hypothetical protein
MLPALYYSLFALLYGVALLYKKDKIKQVAYPRSPSFTRFTNPHPSLQRQLPQSNLQSILPSYLQSWLNFFRAKSVVRALSRESTNGLFTLPIVGQWCVIVHKKDYVKELCNAPEEILSMHKSVEDLMQFRYTVGDQFVDETYHIPVIRSALNSNLSAKLPELLDELVCACSDGLDPLISANGDWSSINPTFTFSRIISRASNRIFVGASICRKEEFIELTTSFSRQVFVGGALIRMLVPSFLRKYAGLLFRYIYGHHRRMIRLLAPSIEVCKRKRAFPPDFAEDSASNMITWLNEFMPEGEEYSTESIAMRLLNINFVALHTTTKAFTHALYNLASEPHYASILREELEMQLNTEDPQNWTKEDFVRCIKLDSFFKETMRTNGLGALWMPRLTVSDFTFSDGTTIPAGNYMSVAVSTIHENPSTYINPLSFDGLRFSRLSEKTRGGTAAVERSEDGWMHRLTGTSLNYLTFGGGRHIWYVLYSYP